VISNDVKKIRGGHLKKVAMQIASAEPGSGHCEGGLKQPQISNTAFPPVSFDLISMNLKHFGETEKFRSNIELYLN
jgi:hypothetical protein